jgi:acetyltransferase-like isoleucine patch superfamily enzyme
MNYNVWGNIISLPESTKIGAYCDLGDPNIGEDCKIQCHVSIPPGWDIGNRVFIGPGVHFANDRKPNLQDTFEIQCGIIGDDVVIGMGALILPCKIGKGAFVAAGSVVVKDVMPFTKVKGNPAKEYA